MRSSTPESAYIDRRIAHAQEVYTPRNLAIYDKLVLGLFCSLVWRCPAREMRRLYDTCVGSCHLDIGPGTGYFLDRCHFPTVQPEITLLDLNAECLKVSVKRLARYRPAICQANLMYPLPLPPHHFDSAGMNLVLHTIPGGWEGKGVVFKHVAEVLRPGGMVFGTTVLAEGVPMNRLTRKLLLAQHERANFQNQGDDPEGLRRQLARHFAESHVVTRGTVAIFKATTAQATMA